MKRTILTFGIISGIVMMIMMSITLPFGKQIGYDKGMIVGYTTMIIALSLIFFAIESYKKTLGVKALTFGQAFKIGLGISLFASAFYIATWLVIYYNFMPNFFDDYMAYQIENMRKKGASDAAIQKTISQFKSYGEYYKNPFVNAAMTFMEIFPIGLLTTLVASFIEMFRNKKASQNAAINEIGRQTI